MALLGNAPAFAEAVEPSQWPAIYSQRTEVQESCFKRMIDHGALNVNYGIKKIEAPDRHQERAVEKLEEKEKKALKKLEKRKAWRKRKGKSGGIGEKKSRQASGSKAAAFD